MQKCWRQKISFNSCAVSIYGVCFILCWGLCSLHLKLRLLVSASKQSNIRKCSYSYWLPSICVRSSPSARRLARSAGGNGTDLVKSSSRGRGARLGDNLLFPVYPDGRRGGSIFLWQRHTDVKADEDGHQENGGVERAGYSWITVWTLTTRILERMESEHRSHKSNQLPMTNCLFLFC